MSFIAYVTRIHFADRVLEDALAEEVRQLGVRRPLVLTDPAAEAASCDEDPFERLRDALPDGCGCERLRCAHADENTARRAAARASETGCDAVIGLGGAIALGLARRVGCAPRRHVAPVIAIPTTTESVGLGPLPGGLGAMATPDGSQPTTGAAGLTPALVLCDPTLTLASGSEETAAAGMDALIHCIEAYLGAGWNPPADGIALEGARRAGACLERAVRDGRDLEARREMLAAALNAGLAAQKGLGAVHALAHALEREIGARHRHGWWHAALLSPALAFNAPAAGDRYGALAQALGSAERDLGWIVADLARRAGLPPRLEHLGLDAAACARVARRAEEDPATRTNPRHATAADYQRMLEQALR